MAGKDGAAAKLYQEKEVQQALEEVERRQQKVVERARANNFTLEELPVVMETLHRNGFSWSSAIGCRVLAEIYRHRHYRLPSVIRP